MALENVGQDSVRNITQAAKEAVRHVASAAQEQAAGPSGLQCADQLQIQSQQSSISAADRAKGKALVDDYLPKLYEAPYSNLLMDISYPVIKLWNQHKFERDVHRAGSDTLKAAREYVDSKIDCAASDRPTRDALKRMRGTIQQELEERGHALPPHIIPLPLNPLLWPFTLPADKLIM